VAIDASFDRVSKLFEADVNRMVARQEARTTGHDRCDFDAVGGTVSYLREGTLLWRAEAELIANLVYGTIDLATGGLLRWVWSERTGLESGRRIDAAYREAKHYKLDTLTKSVPHVDQGEATRIVNMAARLARADGVLARTNEREVTFYALFDTGEGERKSVRSLAPSAGASLLPMRPSLTPAASFGVEPSTGVRSIPAPSITEMQSKTPSLERVRPAASVALAAFVAVQPGFREAVLVVSLELSGTKGRFSVQLVALSSAGRLEVVDTAPPVVEAVAGLVADARALGELGWRTLVVRITPKTAGSGFQLAVESR
jgi:hypothetical protein